MHLRLPLLAAALTASLALPGAVQASPEVPVALPCVDAVAVTVNCAPAPAPAPAPKPAESCPGRDLVPTAANVAAIRGATLCLLNEERADRRLGALNSTPPLQAVAGAYAKRMVRERFFDHTAPDGATFLSRIKRSSYLRGSLRRWSVGENIAWGTGDLATPEQIVQAWMHSPGHRRNILTARFTELGLGVAIGAPRGGQGGAAATYVNEFGQRRR